MKRYCKKVDITDMEFVKDSLHNFLRNKSSRKDVQEFLSSYDSEDDICAEIITEIKERRLAIPDIRYFNRTEPISGKHRVIGRECCKHQVLDYIAVDGLMPLFDAKIGYYQTASLPGKGQIFAQKAIKKWIREKGARYFVKLDIRKYYPSVDQDVLRAMLLRDVKNDDLLYLVFTLLDKFPKGINIGSYLSQYLANYYASKAYHYAQEHLFKYRRNKKTGSVKKKRLISHCLFYMDDILFIGKDKRDMKMAIRKLSKFISDELHVHIKPWKICVIDKEPLDMVGYVFYTYKTTVRPGIFVRAKRAFNKALKASQISLDLAYRCISYYGYFKNSDSRNFIERYRIHQVIKDCKNVVSLAARERNLNESLFPCTA